MTDKNAFLRMTAARLSDLTAQVSSAGASLDALRVAVASYVSAPAKVTPEIEAEIANDLSLVAGRLKAIVDFLTDRQEDRIGLKELHAKEEGDIDDDAEGWKKWKHKDD